MVSFLESLDFSLIPEGTAGGGGGKGGGGGRSPPTSGYGMAWFILPSVESLSDIGASVARTTPKLSYSLKR